MKKINYLDIRKWKKNRWMKMTKRDGAVLLEKIIKHERRDIERERVRYTFADE